MRLLTLAALPKTDDVQRSGLLRQGIGLSPGPAEKVNQRRNHPAPIDRTAFAGHQFSPEVITDLDQALETVIEELIPDAFHNTEQYASKRVSAITVD